MSTDSELEIHLRDIRWLSGWLSSRTTFGDTCCVQRLLHEGCEALRQWPPVETVVDLGSVQVDETATRHELGQALVEDVLYLVPELI